MGVAGTGERCLTADSSMGAAKPGLPHLLLLLRLLYNATFPHQYSEDTAYIGKEIFFFLPFTSLFFKGF